MLNRNRRIEMSDLRIGEDLMEGKEFPQIVFTSTKIETTGQFTGRVTGDLAFMGVVAHSGELACGR